MDVWASRSCAADGAAPKAKRAARLSKAVALRPSSARASTETPAKSRRHPRHACHKPSSGGGASVTSKVSPKCASISPNGSSMPASTSAASAPASASFQAATQQRSSARSSP